MGPWFVMSLICMQGSKGFTILGGRTMKSLAHTSRKRDRFGFFISKAKRIADYPSVFPVLNQRRWISSTSLNSFEEGEHVVPMSTDEKLDNALASDLRLADDTDATTTTPMPFPNTSKRDEIERQYEALAKKLLNDWKYHPAIHQDIGFQSWKVHDRYIQTALQLAEEYLASRVEVLQHSPGRRRIKLVQSGDSEDASKILLIHPDTPPLCELVETCNSTLAEFIRNDTISQGPIVPLSFTHEDFTVSYILAQLLPSKVHPPPSAFETIGHVAHYNFKRHHLPFRFLIGAVTLSQLPHIETVIHKVGQVSGPYRTYEYELLAGEDRLQVQHTEASCKLEFDVSSVYWCSRLSEERQRLIQVEFQPKQVIADAFCGVGALCIQAVRAKQCTILANDWNEKAVEAFQHNARLNHIAGSCTFSQMDAYKFLVDLGVKHSSLPHHVVMNYPLEAPKFLGALRWWPTDATVAPRVHVYTFCESADHALRQVADALIPSDETVFDDFDCNVHVHIVRDVTPNTTVACVSFSATSELLKVIQGDFS